MLKDEKYILESKLRANSWLRNCEIVKDGKQNVVFFDIKNLPSKDKIDLVGRYYQVQSGDRLDLIASKFYRDETLWWLIAWANDIELGDCELYVGRKLLIPNRNLISILKQ